MTTYYPAIFISARNYNVPAQDEIAQIIETLAAEQ
jgi:hypothetical protein